MKKIVSFLLTGALLLCLLAPTAYAAEVRTVTVELPRYAATASISRDYSTAAAYILKRLEAGENPINVSDYRIPKSDALSLFVGLLADHPEYFYIKTGLQYTYNSVTGNLIEITYFQTVSGSELEKQKAAFTAAAEEILSGASADMTDMEKTLYLHDTLALRIDYDYVNYEANSIPDASYTAYGAMVDGVAVCQGYSMAFIYLAKQLDLDSCFISSDSMNHGWNAVKVDGNWYYMDITHDDAVLSMYGSYIYNTDVRHNRFLLNEEELTAAGYSDDRQVVSLEHTDVDCTDSFPDAGYIWQGKNTPFFYRDGVWYYTEDGVVYCSAADGSGKTVYYDGAAGEIYSYSRFLMQGRRIYFNTKNGVYTVDPQSQALTCLAEESGGSIVGLGLRPDGRLVYEGFDADEQYYSRYLTLSLTDTDAVIEQIAALPWFITEADRTAVEAARSAYNALPASQQQQVTNLRLLEEAERVLKELESGLAFSLGDVNRDRRVSVSDVVTLRWAILQSVVNESILELCDLSGDNTISVADVVDLRQYILDSAA